MIIEWMQLVLLKNKKASMEYWIRTIFLVYEIEAANVDEVKEFVSKF